MQLKQLVSKTLISITLGLLLGGGLFPLQANDSSVDENHQTEDLEKLLDKYQQDSQAVLDSYEHFDENANTLSEEDVKSLENSGLSEAQKNSVKRSGKDALKQDYFNALRKQNKNGLNSLTLKEQVALAIRPLQTLEDKRLIEFLNRSLSNSPLAPILQHIPNFTTLLKDVIKSEEAIPGFFNTFEDRKKLLYFAGAMLCTIIIGFITKKMFYGKHYGCVGTVVGFFLHCIFMLGIRVGVIVYFFGNDLSPLFKIITNWSGNQF